MANPFLFMEEEVTAVNAVSDAFANPFLVEDDDDDAGDFSAENPFSASNPFAFNDTSEENHVATTTAGNFFPSDTVTQSGANLFLVDDDNDDQQVDATMSFFGTTINEHDGLQYQKPSDLNVANQHGLIDDSVNAYSSEEELKAKKPPRPNPPSRVTQQLITNLTDHLDQTSTNLLGKLPVTRTPSPVSMRDLHSPSPTPDFGDLLDVSETTQTAAQQVDNSHSFAAQPVAPEPEHKPMRPPPPRPVPPRPTPPRGSVKSSPVTAPTPVHPTYTATVTQAQPPAQQEDDLFNFFGTGQQKKPPPKPPAPKTKEDILSLFQAPSQPVQQTQKQDLLSEDIDFTTQVQHQTQAPVAVVQPYEPQQEITNEAPAPIPQAIVEPMVHQPVENHVIVKSQSIPTIEMDLTPDLPIDSDDMPTIIEDVAQIKSEISSDYSPESGITSGGILASASGSVLNMTMAENEPVPEVITIQEPYEEPQDEANPFAAKALTPPEQLQEMQFLQQKSNEYQYQRPTTPDPIVSQPELAPIFGGPLPSTSPAKPAPPPPPARISSVLTTPVQPPQQQLPHVVPEIFKSDEFDDFSAKFDSKSQPKVTTGNAFLDSLGEEPVAATADAWGDSDAFGGPSIAVDDGFGNEEDGFDSWNVPVVPESTPYMNRRMSNGSDDGKDFSVVIKPKGANVDFANVAPILGPPPPQRSPYSGSAYSEGKNRKRKNKFNIFYTKNFYFRFFSSSESI